MLRDDTYLVDILQSAKMALDYISGKSWDEFYGDMQCQDAVIRRIEISVRLHDGCHRKLATSIRSFHGAK